MEALGKTVRLLIMQEYEHTKIPMVGDDPGKMTTFPQYYYCRRAADTCVPATIYEDTAKTTFRTSPATLELIVINTDTDPPFCFFECL